MLSDKPIGNIERELVQPIEGVRREINSPLIGCRQRKIRQQDKTIPLTGIPSMGYSMESPTRKQMIEDVLQEKGFSKLALARQLGRSVSTINRWIDGDSTPELTPQETSDMLEIFGDLETLIQMFPGYSRRREAMKRVSK